MISKYALLHNDYPSKHVSYIAASIMFQLAAFIFISYVIYPFLDILILLTNHWCLLSPSFNVCELPRVSQQSCLIIRNFKIWTWEITWSLDGQIWRLVASKLDVCPDFMVFFFFLGIAFSVLFMGNKQNDRHWVH